MAYTTMLTILMARPSVTAIVDMIVVGCCEIDEESLSKTSKSYEVDVDVKKQRVESCLLFEVTSSEGEGQRRPGRGGCKLIRS
jgi:hypothetical protein